MPTIAVDWSGRAKGAGTTIWTAVVDGGELRSLECGRDREATVDHLIELAADEVVVGLDFSFSFPGWFSHQLGAATADELWSMVAHHGEDWLARCDPPFWGRTGRGRPEGEGLRRTEREVPSVIRPKSTFQINGAGTVGTGAIRGMPQLARLRAAGFSIWPFHGGTPPVVVEMWPRLLTGPVVKSNAAARRAYLAERFPGLDAVLGERASSTEDAFDAAVSALVMDRHRDELLHLSGPADDVDAVEGRIWVPQALTT